MRTFGALSASVALAVLVAGCQNTVSSTQLKVGDCVNEALTSDDENGQTRVYEPVDCAKAHDDEVFSVFDFPNASSFPGYEAIGALRQTRCQADFQGYIGVAWDKSQFTIAYVSPDEQDWAAGNHAIHCLLSDASDAQTTGSSRGSKK